MKTFSAKYVKYIMLFKAGLSVRSSVLPSAPAHTTWLLSSHVFLQKLQYHVHTGAHGSHFMMSGVPLQGCQALAHSIIHIFKVIVSSEMLYIIGFMLVKEEKTFMEAFTLLFPNVCICMPVSSFSFFTLFFKTRFLTSENL